MKMRKTLRSAHHTYHPIKIAVLDTGLVSDSHYDFVTYRDFADSEQKDRIDKTLHGTASVDLVLKAYPEAKLYVGRVFNTDQTDEKTEPARLAEVGEQTYPRHAICSVDRYRPSIGRPKKVWTSSTSLRGFKTCIRR